MIEEVVEQQTWECHQLRWEEIIPPWEPFLCKAVSVGMVRLSVHAGVELRWESLSAGSLWVGMGRGSAVLCHSSGFIFPTKKVISGMPGMHFQFGAIGIDQKISRNFTGFCWSPGQLAGSDGSAATLQSGSLLWCIREETLRCSE